MTIWDDIIAWVNSVLADAQALINTLIYNFNNYTVPWLNALYDDLWRLSNYVDTLWTGILNEVGDWFLGELDYVWSKLNPMIENFYNYTVPSIDWLSAEMVRLYDYANAINAYIQPAIDASMGAFQSSLDFILNTKIPGINLSLNDQLQMILGLQRYVTTEVARLTGADVETINALDLAFGVMQGELDQSKTDNENRILAFVNEIKTWIIENVGGWLITELTAYLEREIETELEAAAIG